jgi:hypothetical protein
VSALATIRDLINQHAIPSWHAASLVLDGRLPEAGDDDLRYDLRMEWWAINRVDEWRDALYEAAKERGALHEEEVDVESPAGLHKAGWGWEAFVSAIHEVTGLLTGDEVPEQYRYANREAKRALGLDPDEPWTQVLPSAETLAAVAAVVLLVLVAWGFATRKR